MTNSAHSNRNADGKYTYSKLDLVCVCGHTLGQHSAERVKGQQPCFCEDGDGCACESFKRARAPKARPAIVVVVPAANCCDACGSPKSTCTCPAGFAARQEKRLAE